jgi:hypothetical protein
VGRPDKRAADKVNTDGPWLGLSLRFLRSKACAELSPHGLKMLIDLCSQLAPNAGRNGDLSMAPCTMKARGWKSEASARSALMELQDAGLVVVSRQGQKRKCTLYAVTLWPLACDLSKIEIKHMAYTRTDWRGAGDARAVEPTEAQPATWRALRARVANQYQIPRSGCKGIDIHPQRADSEPHAASYAPAADA